MASYSLSLEWIIFPFVTEARKETELWGTVTEKYQKSERGRFRGVKFLQESYALSWLLYAQHGTSAGWSVVECFYTSTAQYFACSTWFGSSHPHPQDNTYFGST